MKIKMSDAINSTEALNAISQKPFSAATAFKIAKLISSMSQPLKDFESIRNKLLQEIGEPSEDGQVKIKEPERWKSEMGALLEQEIDVPDEKFSIQDFGNADIEPRLLIQLGWCVDLK